VSRPEPLPTRFDPTSFEEKWYAKWEASGAFTPEQPSDRPPYVILIPPPNVTGKLHIGHALQFTLQDLVIRWRRMQGYNALWLPGTDHAGIATQVMVERELAKEGTGRRELGREKFLERMWQWKAQYKDNISHQAKALGASCDWTRERFTLDPMLSRAVRDLFVEWFERLDLPFKKSLVPMAHNWAFESSFLKAWLGISTFEEIWHSHDQLPDLGSSVRLIRKVPAGRCTVSPAAEASIAF